MQGLRTVRLRYIHLPRNERGLLTMEINPNQKYKIVDKDLINGSFVLTGKELNAILEESYKEVMQSKKETA